MKVWINIYTLKSSPNIPYALAYKTEKLSKEQKNVKNDDLVFQRRINIELTES